MGLVSVCVQNGVKVDTEVRKSANSLRKNISKVTELLTVKNAPNFVSPSFEWAQSADSVFIGVKFAHKIGAPSCTDTHNEVVEMSSTAIKLNVTCRGKNKIFALDLELFSPIDPESSVWSIASVGRGTFTLLKATPGIEWERLLLSENKPRNMGVWWSMQDRYTAELAALNTKASNEALKEEPAPINVANETASSPPVNEKKQLKKRQISELKTYAKNQIKWVKMKVQSSLLKADVSLSDRKRVAEMEYKLKVDNLEVADEDKRNYIIAAKDLCLKQISESLKDAIDELKGVGNGEIGDFSVISETLRSRVKRLVSEVHPKIRFVDSGSNDSSSDKYDINEEESDSESMVDSDDSINANETNNEKEDDGESIVDSDETDAPRDEL